MTWRLLGIGFSVGFGVVISHHKSTGWQVASYSESFGGGIYVGKPGASIGLQVTLTPSDKSIHDVEGSSIGISLEHAQGFQRIGGGISFPVEEGNIDFSKPSFTISLSIPYTSVGVETGGMVSYTYTNVLPIHIDPWWEDKDQSDEKTLSDNNEHYLYE